MLRDACGGDWTMTLALMLLVPATAVVRTVSFPQGCVKVGAQG
jgi:hypothetical protein